MRTKKLFVRLRRGLLLALSGALLATTGGMLPTAAAQPKPADISSVTWGDCPDFGYPVGDLECGMVQVPLNYGNPNNVQIKIAVSRLKARNPGLRQGAMLLNPGGPGGPGLDMPVWMSDLMPQSVLDRYDLIGFDPRGVGRSAPVTCGLSILESAQIAPPVEQNNNFDDTAAFMQRAAHGCSVHGGNYMQFMTTANTARDMERIRQALGEDKISYFGYSYGTYLGAVYASLYPNKTDRFVLDSATQPRGAWREQFRSWKIAEDTRFPDFGRFLIANKATYDLGGTQAQVRQTYFQLVDQLNANPIELGDNVMVDGAWFRLITFSGLYSDAYFAETAEFWKLIKDSGPSVDIRALVQSLSPRLFEEFPDVPEDNSPAATNAVLCDDIAWPRSVDQYRRELAADNAQYPMFSKLGSHIWPCAFWPTSPIEPPVPITPFGPGNKILIIQNLRDPATPYAGAIEMRAKFGLRARIVSVVQGGHGASYGAGNDCAQGTVTNYFVQGTFPSYDPLCPAQTRGMQTFSASDAPQKAMKTLHHRMW